jgi:16S rRNA G966 N2-methylase RsmD
MKSVEFIRDFNKKNNFGINVIKKDVFSFIKQTNMSFDVIFADPPYHINEMKYYELITLIFNRKLINDSGLFVIEHSSKITLDNHKFFSNSRKYGDSSFSFYININN